MNDESCKLLNAKWNSLSNSDQSAVNCILDLIEEDMYDISELTDEKLKNYVNKGCSHISNNNTEVKHKDEDFYKDDFDKYKIFNYLQLKRNIDIEDYE